VAFTPQDRLRANGHRDVVRMPDFQSEKTRRRDADDLGWMIVDSDLPPDGRGIPAELALPKGVADHGSRKTTTTAVVGSRENSAHKGLDTEHAKEITANKKALGKPYFATGREVKTIAIPCDHAGENIRVVTEFLPDGVRKGGVRSCLMSPDAGFVGKLHGD